MIAVSKQRVFIIGILTLLIFLVFTAGAFAYSVVVGAHVNPVYTLQRKGDTLFLQTNMTLYLNGNRIFH